MSDALKTNDGGSIRLGRELGRGGEGSVCEVEGQPGLCAKIYAAKAVNARLHDKLRAMVADPPKDPTVATKNHHSIAWPTQLLYRGPDDPLYFAGFVMPAIAGQDFKKAICRFHPGDRRKEFGGDFTWLYAYTAAMNIASAVAAIHERGYCIGDINESNILVAGSTMSTLIDCDSFQVRDAKTGRVFRCVVGKGEYTAPELGGKRYADVDRTAATDHFGLAVLMFQFLMEGCHPYQARGPLVEDAPTTEKKISLGHFPYRHAKKHAGVEPPAYAPSFDILHPELQGLFVRAFVDGHKDPGARPTSLEWYGSLFRQRDQLVECKANPNHRYFGQLGACPWCRLFQERGTDPYPAPGNRPAQVLKDRAGRARSRAAVPGAGRSISAVGMRSLLARCVSTRRGKVAAVLVAVFIMSAAVGIVYRMLRREAPAPPPLPELGGITSTIKVRRAGDDSALQYAARAAEGQLWNEEEHAAKIRASAVAAKAAQEARAKPEAEARRQRAATAEAEFETMRRHTNAISANAAKSGFGARPFVRPHLQSGGPCWGKWQGSRDNKCYETIDECAQAGNSCTKRD